MHAFCALKLYHFNCAVNVHFEKLETIYRSSVLKNGSKIWFLAFLNYRCYHFFLSNRFLWSFYLAFTNGFDQKKTSSYSIYGPNIVKYSGPHIVKYNHKDPWPNKKTFTSVWFREQNIVLNWFTRTTSYYYLILQNRGIKLGL